jgi:hypothetical protein
MDKEMELAFQDINQKLNILLIQRTRGVTRDAAWMDALITNLKTNGETAALAFVYGNYLQLANLGLDLTHAVLVLFAKGQSNAAQVILDSRMTPDQASAQAGIAAANLAAQTAAHEKFVKDLESFAMTLLPVVAKLVLTAAATAVTGGLAI